MTKIILALLLLTMTTGAAIAIDPIDELLWNGAAITSTSQIKYADVSGNTLVEVLYYLIPTESGEFTMTVDSLWQGQTFATADVAVAVTSATPVADEYNIRESFGSTPDDYYPVYRLTVKSSAAVTGTIGVVGH